jgi:hypothetical protein
MTSDKDKTKAELIALVPEGAAAARLQGLLGQNLDLMDLRRSLLTSSQPPESGIVGNAGNAAEGHGLNGTVKGSGEETPRQR